MTTYDRLMKVRQERGAGYFVLLDPDKNDLESLPSFIREATEAGADAFLVGGSLMLTNVFEDHLRTIKQNTSVPVIIFPGSIRQVSPLADAILFLVLISGRNPFLASAAALDTTPEMARPKAAVDPDEALLMLPEPGGGPPLRGPARDRAFGKLQPPTKGLALIVGLAIGSPEFQRR